MKLVLNAALLRRAALGLVVLFVVWNGVALAIVLRRSSQTVKDVSLAERIESLSNKMTDELSLQSRESEVSEGATAAAERMGRFVALWTQGTRNIEEQAGNLDPAIRARLSRAAQWMSTVRDTRGRLTMLMPEDNRKLLDAEFRSNVSQALVEIRTALAELRNPPRELLEAERRARIADLVLSLVFGLALAGALAYPVVRSASGAPPWHDDHGLALWFEHSKEAVLTLDRDAVIVSANPAALELFGYAEADVTGRPLTSLIPSAGRKHDKTVPGGPALELRAAARTSDGSSIPVMVTLVRPEGRPGVHAVAIVHQPAAAPDAGADAARENATSAEMLRDAPVPLLVFDPTGRIIRANRACERITGYTASELSSRPYWEIFLRPTQVEQARHEFEAGPRLSELTDQTWSTPAGKTIQFRWARKAAYDPQGKLLHVLAAMMPVGATVVPPDPEAGPPVADPIEISRKLAENVAQSFGHHLTAINGYSDLLLGALAPDDPNRDDLEEIRRSGERAAALTGQLQYFSRRSAPESKPVPLNAFILGLEPGIRALLHANVVLAFRINEDAGVVTVDSAQLQQAIVSLAINAQDAMPAGGRLIIETATVFSEDRGWWSVLEITDTGKGMDEETKASIFQPFFSTKVGGRGTGLGLAVVNDILTRHNGIVDVISSPGQGTTFRIYLPRTDQSPFSQPNVAARQSAP